MFLHYNAVFGVKEASLTIPYHYINKLYYSVLKDVKIEDDELLTLLREIKDFLIDNY